MAKYEEIAMPFTVLNPNGAKTDAYQLYSRLLRKQKVDLGKAPRILEPGTHRRYLYVWDDREKAQAFAREMKKQSGDPQWQVREVKTPVCEGPLGPIFIIMTIQSDGWTFSLDPLSHALLRSAFPQALGPTRIFIDSATWQEFQKMRGDLSVLAEQTIRTLTGLEGEHLRKIGYVLVDPDESKELITVPPA
jgi:hypothetical protein